MTYGNPWMLMPYTADTEARQDSVARAIRRQKRKDYDAAAASRTTGGQKPHTFVGARILIFFALDLKFVLKPEV
jgi:hypothetical protein